MKRMSSRACVTDSTVGALVDVTSLKKKSQHKETTKMSKKEICCQTVCETQVFMMWDFNELKFPEDI